MTFKNKYLWITSILISVTSLVSTCPHDDVTLSRWSDPGTWPNNKLPVAGDIVNITVDVLLDISPPELFGVVVESGSKLVWSPDGEYHVITKYIHVKGEFHMGSESCPFEANARITLTGDRKEYSFPSFGQKFIGVDNGGTLEIHGKRKLGWTKLTKTLPGLTSDNGLLFAYSDNPTHRRYQEGLGVYIFNADGTVFKQEVFTTTGTDVASIAWLLHYMSGIPDGKVVLVAVQHTLVSNPQHLDLTSVFNAIEDVSGIPRGQSKIRNVGQYDAYGLATIKGDPAATVEVHTPVSYLSQKAVASVETANYVMIAESHPTTGGSSKPWLTLSMEFLVVEKAKEFHILDVFDDVSSWEEGDKVLLTSTDFDPNKAEEAIVVNCGECTGKQVKVKLFPKYKHYGDIESNVDMRGEVALLSRNIVIDSAMNTFCPGVNENCDTYKFDTFGGHIKVIRGFKDVHIEGAELVHMGKQTDLGHYPLHFHMCFDVDGDDYPNPPYLRENSIHHSFARCVTIHGTHGLQVMDNVGYESLGHCYFLEDGGERRTLLDGNLGASTRKGSLIPSDSRPTTFWVTNPNTVVRNNVAAGSEDTGLWFIYPDSPMGPSADKGFMQLHEARHTAITECSNNVIHSNLHAGLFIDFRLNNNTGEILTDSNHYSPKVNPLDSKSEDKQVPIDRLTVYKNNVNVWTRGGYFIFNKASMAESQTAITCVREAKRETFVLNSVILGETNNIGERMLGWGSQGLLWFNKSIPNQWDYHGPVQGFVFYDGPTYVYHTFFNGFVSNQFRTASAIGFQRENKFYSASVSSSKDIRFGFVDDLATGNRVFDGDGSMHGFGDFDGDLQAIFRDVDGSVTTIPGSSIVRPYPYLMTPACFIRNNWNLAICPHKYIKFPVFIISGDGHGQVPVILRDDIPDSTLAMTAKWTFPHFTMITGGQYSYSMHWPAKSPSEYWLSPLGQEKDQPVRVGLCLPRHATFNLVTFYPKYAPHISMWTKVNNIGEIDRDTVGGKYFHDEDSGMLYMKFLTPIPRGENDTKECTADICPGVGVYITGGDLNDADCRGRDTPTPPAQEFPESHRVQASMSFTTVYSNPEPDWGAGSQIPFPSRGVIDGKYGDWSDWSGCSATCGGGVSVRSRKCDNPIPRGGADCVGPDRETQSCNPNSCLTAVNGGFSDWVEWSTCVPACQGSQTRSRTCDNPTPQFGGIHCSGYTEEVRPCGDGNCA